MYYSAQQFNFADFNYPVPWSAYRGQPGCVQPGNASACATILDKYAPAVAMPTWLTALQNAWTGCIVMSTGVYDPPIALQTKTSVEVPTVTWAASSTSLDIAAAPIASANLASATSTPAATTPNTIPTPSDTLFTSGTGFVETTGPSYSSSTRNIGAIIASGLGSTDPPDPVVSASSISDNEQSGAATAASVDNASHGHGTSQPPSVLLTQLENSGTDVPPSATPPSGGPSGTLLDGHSMMPTSIISMAISAGLGTGSGPLSDSPANIVVSSVSSDPLSEIDLSAGSMSSISTAETSTNDLTSIDLPAASVSPTINALSVLAAATPTEDTGTAMEGFGSTALGLSSTLGTIASDTDPATASALSAFGNTPSESYSRDPASSDSPTSTPSLPDIFPSAEGPPDSAYLTNSMTTSVGASGFGPTASGLPIPGDDPAHVSPSHTSSGLETTGVVSTVGKSRLATSSQSLVLLAGSQTRTLSGITTTSGKTTSVGSSEPLAGGSTLALSEASTSELGATLQSAAYSFPASAQSSALGREASTTGTSVTSQSGSSSRRISDRTPFHLLVRRHFLASLIIPIVLQAI